MDCGSTGTAAGIDPKILDNWQTDAAFSIPSWEHPPYEQPLEWDTSQGSTQGDIDIVELNTFRASLSKHHPNATYLDQSCGFHGENSKHGTASPEKFSLSDGPIEGTASGTVSPRTLPSSADDNFQLDESWPQYQLFSAMAAGIPMEAPSLLYPYSKEPANSTNTVIVDDIGELPQGHGLSDIPSEHFLSFQNIPQPFPFTAPEAWTEPPTNPATESMGSQAPPASISLGPELPNKEISHVRNFQAPLRSLESRWLDSLESQLPSNMNSPTSLPTLPQGLAFFKEENPGQDGFQYKSESSSVSGDFPAGVYDCSYSATSDDVPAFAERQLDEECPWNAVQKDEPEISQPFQNATAFMVSEAPSESFFASVPSRSKVSSSAARAAARPHALALQSVATVRKRKQRGSNHSLDLGQPKPLQIVQEDGQGGSIASADFVSPPRGARRKGPLTMVGRANAGLRRKNKDTCVQCRLNKRKCDGNSPCDACRPTLHEQPCARACFANIVEYGTCNYVSQRAVNHPTLDGKGRVRMDIPVEFDLNDLISFLGERQGRFNIRARQAWGSLYVLDLGEAYKFLRSLSDYNGNSRSNFLDFIDRRIVESKDKSKNWLSCVKECDPINNFYALLSQWNNMPSRARYSFVPLHPGAQERPMDIHDADDRREILLAAQLSRIVCRMLEVEGFRKLERDFYNIKWKQISQETHIRFLNELGNILLTLRWRVSWWRRLGDGGQEADPSTQHYVDRVDLLCRILYVYYTCVLAKLPSWCAADVPKGVWSTYADTENSIWDDFPVDPTDDGFQMWMDRGKELVEQAGAPKGTSKIAH
ncbi:hypothetical protein BDV28DRAFT_140205 [Aspergillus coremiiformis]|uniref:Zn(2)-C6 fungal-type domain-containing protein n=1 Tax=Aspergillus coremiiformis TaxID=138285 RepID=A0A5N6YWU1_9EURO|nr:hypothetical protein BDV28DRAFT_140205 [Aspergillus coremiiformis]